jgi:hypothetical protein
VLSVGMYLVTMLWRSEWRPHALSRPGEIVEQPSTILAHRES